MNILDQISTINTWLWMKYETLFVKMMPSTSAHMAFAVGLIAGKFLPLLGWVMLFLLGWCWLNQYINKGSVLVIENGEVKLELDKE